MPRAVGSKDYIGLTGGLITEASPLNFPEGATADEVNFVLDLNGMVRARRKGLEDTVTPREEVLLPLSLPRFEEVMYWQSADLFVFVYSVLGDTPQKELRVLKNDSSFTLVGSVSLDASDETVSMAESTEYLVVTTGESTPPVLLEYVKQFDSVRLNTLDLYIRDFELVESLNAVSVRPGTFNYTDDHEYNLLNAGWYAERRLESTGLLGDPITDFFNSEALYPSTADIAYLGVKFDADADQEKFSSDTLKETIIGNSVAPRGHYIYSIGDFERTDKLNNPEQDGTPNSTITQLQSWSL